MRVRYLIGFQVAILEMSLPPSLLKELHLELSYEVASSDQPLLMGRNHDFVPAHYNTPRTIDASKARDN
jgi:hypothetical protein